jgi:hypothetical protein
MITYTILINNIFQSSIQANSRGEAVNMANDLYSSCAGIHVSKPSQWGGR